ncbi:hypothetical protein MXB_4050 [Myxobolus squamalis]|nr:hypothetical protein MXB_4050 [Myxobolus squamalis]
MGLSTELLVGIRAKKYYIPSPIQEEAIPAILKNKNVLARAKNGTGKTASFLIPLIQKVDLKINHIQSLVIVPTRELAIQTSNACAELSQFTAVKSCALTGGTKKVDDVAHVKKVHILVTTTGRIHDFSCRNLIDLSHVSTICIDEVS